jgi:hypothetical protein
MRTPNAELTEAQAPELPRALVHDEVGLEHSHFSAAKHAVAL